MLTWCFPFAESWNGSTFSERVGTTGLATSAAAIWAWSSVLETNVVALGFPSKLTVEEENGQSTKYSLDPATARIARFEFVRGEPRSARNTNAVVHSYSFDDFRSVDGIATPFRIEHFVDGVKREELQLKTVRYNSTAIGASLTQPLGR